MSIQPQENFSTTIERCPHDRKNPYVMLDKNIISDPRLSLEAIGIYGMLECEAIKLEEIPDHLLKELREIGYLEEV